MTTLTQARKALLKLVDSLPAESTYGANLATIADYLDNQVPLNIENKALREQLATRRTEGFGRIKPRVVLVDKDPLASSMASAAEFVRGINA